jgi:Protein of unknown function (DUF4238)
MFQQNPPSKHHYVPAFYLRRWERQSDMKLTEFTKPFGSKIAAKPVGAMSTGFDQNLYSLEGYEPELAQQVEEQFFKPVDEEASTALVMLERFGHRAPWDSESRSAWTRFLLSLLLRCPEDIEALRGWWRSEGFGSPGPRAEARYARTRGPEHPERFSEFLQSQPVTMKERRLFQSLYNLIDNASVGTEINHMKWRILESPLAAPTFLTSDRPVIRTASLHGAGAHIALPISPRLLFIATPDTGILDSVLKAHQIKLVKEINCQIVEGAQRFVYGCDDSQSRFIKNHFGVNPQPRLVEQILRKTPDIPADSPLPSRG